MPCEYCGVEGPTQFSSFEQNIGLVLTRLTTKIEKELCRRCMVQCFRSYTLTTLFCGWWGMISFFMTPVILAANTASYWQARKLPDPGMSIYFPPGSSPPRVASGPFALKLIVGLLAWGTVFTVIAYHHVELMEKHAPGLNARLHQGEITDAEGAAYSITKVSNPEVRNELCAVYAEIYVERESHYGRIALAAAFGLVTRA